jgi:hypothetical protein
MINLPIRLRPADEASKRWLLTQLDVLREMIDAGEPVAMYSTTETGADGPVDIAHVAYRRAEYERRWRARRQRHDGRPNGRS